ncbi:MAG: acyl transferase [Sphingobacteriales bacterium]|nr:acyl transferase [Sphingobacteriales bacterium]
MQQKIFSGEGFDFEQTALEVFEFQYTHNSVYRQFTDYLKINPKNVTSVLQIPFLPIEFFKTHRIISDNGQPQKIFESSGTTGQLTGKHLVADLNLYEESFQKGFVQFYGNIKDWTILALLPSYLERNSSSLIYMINDLIQKSEKEDSGFYLYNLEELAKKISNLSSQISPPKILLIGVTFALLDFAEQYPMDLPGVTVMETGGMKGKREEITRAEVHNLLKKAFNLKQVHSEYGMTELLSQAYSKGEGIFQTPPWMKILKRDIYNPLSVCIEPGRGGLNVIDLANIHSCAFIATQDVVNMLVDDHYEILGRLDNSDIRGCNLMVTSSF